MRIRGDGGTADEDGGSHAQVPEVRTRGEASGGWAGGDRRGLSATVVGGGLAGSEAAWALAERAVRVTLHEMRPVKMTAAHQTDRLAELVCSNSFKSVELTNAHGLLKAEMRRLGSIVLEAADAARVPGGAALAVDRVAFSQAVHDRVTGHPGVTLVRGEATELPSPGIVATGPLTSDVLAAAIAARLDGLTPGAMVLSPTPSYSSGRKTARARCGTSWASRPGSRFRSSSACSGRSRVSSARSSCASARSTATPTSIRPGR